MVTKLTPYEENWALILEQPILDQLGIDAATPLEVSIDDGVLTVAPAANSARQEKLTAALQETNERYSNALRRLAE